jgi:ribosomal protein L11 methyltransferase
MFSVYLRVPDAQRDSTIAELWEWNTTGITEEGDALRAFFEGDVDREALLKSMAAFDPVVAEEADHDWVRESQDQWEPLEVGQRWFLAPEWRSDATPEGRLRLSIYPGRACGTGRHPATRLCLQAIEQVLGPQDRVLDVGTGSGILAHAALLMGCAQVMACDIDHEASLVAKENFERVSVSVPLFTGSLRSVREGKFTCLVANLNEATLSNLSAEFRRVASDDTTVIVAGFREDEVESVSDSLGRPVVDRLEEEDWVCLVMRGPAAPPKPPKPSPFSAGSGHHRPQGAGPSHNYRR